MGCLEVLPLTQAFSKGTDPESVFRYMRELLDGPSEQLANF